MFLEHIKNSAFSFTSALSHWRKKSQNQFLVWVHSRNNNAGTESENKCVFISNSSWKIKL